MDARSQAVQHRQPYGGVQFRSDHRLFLPSFHRKSMGQAFSKFLLNIN